MTNSAPNLPAVARASHARLTDAERIAFLRALAVTGSHAAAARAINRPRSTLHSFIATHESFALECESALDAYAATLLETAHMLAVDGVEVPIMHAGEVVGMKRKHSEKVLLKLIERLGPVEFRPLDKKTVVHEHTGTIEHKTANAVPLAVLKTLPLATQFEIRKAMIEDAFKSGLLTADQRLEKLADVLLDAREYNLPIADERAFVALPAPNVVDIESVEIADSAGDSDEVPNFL